jgi:hypothetical protein
VRARAHLRARHHLRARSMADMEDAPLPKLFAGDGAGASAAACVTASAEAVAGFSLGGRYYDELMACTDGLQKLQSARCPCARSERALSPSLAC